MICKDCRLPGDMRYVELCPLHESTEYLLDALKRMLAHRESQLLMAGTTRKALDVEQAKAAIAKAEVK